MAGLLFVAQTMLDSWAEQGKIDFVGSVMTLLAGEGRGRSYTLEPAVRFLALEGSDVDHHQLLRKVKSQAQLRALGAELLGGSLLLDEVAYRVEPGFLAEASALQAAASVRAEPAAVGQVEAGPAVAAPPAAPHATAPGPGPTPPRAPAQSPPGAPDAPARPYVSAPLPRELEERRKEAEALARFLLDNLS